MYYYITLKSIFENETEEQHKLSNRTMTSIDFFHQRLKGQQLRKSQEGLEDACKLAINYLYFTIRLVLVLSLIYNSLLRFPFNCKSKPCTFECLIVSSPVVVVLIAKGFSCNFIALHSNYTVSNYYVAEVTPFPKKNVKENG